MQGTELRVATCKVDSLLALSFFLMLAVKAVPQYLLSLSSCKADSGTLRAQMLLPKASSFASAHISAKKACIISFCVLESIKESCSLLQAPKFVVSIVPGTQLNSVRPSCSDVSSALVR